MKTFKSRLAAIVTLLCSLTANAYGFKVDEICYTKTSDTTVCVTYNGVFYSGAGTLYNYNGKYTGDIIIPKEVTKDNIIYRVTSIEEHAFDDCSNLTSVNIPESVTSIGEYAFDNCSSLTSITIPEGVTSIGRGAFYDCSSLTSITIPESVTSIGGNAFSDCSSLTAVHISSLEAWCRISFLGNMFPHCSSNPLFYAKNLYLNGNLVTELSIPEGVTSIGSYTFYNCNNLISINIPESVTSIGNYAFYGCSKLYKVINYSNLALSVDSDSYGYVASYAKQIINGSKLTTIGDFQFSTSNGIHYLENYIGQEQNIVLPNDYDGSNYQIGTCAFYGYNNLYSVTIGSGVLSIGSYAFSIVPEKTIWLTNTPPTGYANAKGNINYVANDQYTSLNNVQIYPYLSSMFEVNGVKYVPVSPSERTCHAIDCAYNSTAAAINVSETASFKGIAMTVKEVMPYTFYGNKHIKEVNISHKGNIGNYAFYDCDSVQSVELSNEGNVGSQAFYDCDGMLTATISNQGNIESQAFCNCDAIESVTIANQGDIGEQAFYDCNGIKTIEINNRGSIGAQAFYGCNRMETAVIANLAPVVSSNTDNGVPLTFADWTSTNKSHSTTSSNTYTFTAKDGAVLSFDWWVSSENGYDKLIATLDGTTILEKSGSLSGTYSNAVSQGEHTLIVKYTKDGSNSSGSDQAKVSNIVVSKGSDAQTIARVGNEAFSGCSSLKTVTLGDSIGSLGSKAFYNCSCLQEIVIPDSVKAVGEYCFSGCSAMKSAVLGDGLANIAKYTFANCGLEEIIIGDNITSIGDYAFKGCSGMKSAVLGDGLTEVNGTMFNGCIGLENVEIGNKVTELEANAFSGCSSLKDVKIGSGVATINNYAFSGCSSLPTITIPQAVTKIGDKVFVGCSKLADVIIADRTEPLALGSNSSSPLFVDCPLDSVYIGGKITYNTTSSKGYSPFYRNTSLRTVVITDREEQIYNNEFYGCTNLQNVTIGNGVKSIGNYAFSGCSSLEGFSFGSNMETIGDEAFSDCTSLTSITSHAAVPPTCGTQALDDINKWGCTLRVPSGYASAYQGANQWKEFFFVDDVVEVAKYTLTFMVDGEVYHTSSLVHKAEVTIPDAPTKEGYTFSGWNKVPATMPAEDVVFNGFFTINKYLVTFKIGDEVISSESLEYGANIVVPVVPEKKGHSFNGWGEVAKTVPAGDLTYEGSYSVNSYLLTYMVDGEIVQSDSIAYGTKLVTPKDPTKEGHTFSGWGKVPATMPAENTTISGFFTPNTYKVYYYADGKLVHTAKVTYGEAIPEYVYEPTAEGDKFMGWAGETYETMPAHDVTYTANITNDISQCTISDSQLTIYDLNGRKIETDDLRELEKGIYIVNGKKVMIK